MDSEFCRRFIERTQAAVAPILRRVALHAIAVRAGLAGSELFEQPPLEVGRHRVLQLLGFFVDFVPFHAENFGQHALDQMMPVEQPIGDIAAGRRERNACRRARCGSARRASDA